MAVFLGPGRIALGAHFGGCGVEVHYYKTTMKVSNLIIVSSSVEMKTLRP